ncbi:hypothetical protein NEUTE2DRAFT_67548 [Neurospora tetrasperma FGSC 2509]|nr:hypothetical protein NEUTE2DRAFT_67548 [Neurospora tetrasperma FGSC 2509]
MDEKNFAVVSFLSHADADGFSPCFVMTSTLTFYSMSSKCRYRQLQIFKRGLPRTKSISRVKMQWGKVIKGTGTGRKRDRTVVNASEYRHNVNQTLCSVMTDEPAFRPPILTHSPSHPTASHFQDDAFSQATIGLAVKDGDQSATTHIGNIEKHSLSWERV